MNQELIFEIKRQLFHLVLGICITFAVYFLYPYYGKLLVIPPLIAVIVMLSIPKITSNLHIANHLLYHFEREDDRENFPFRGAIWYSIGIMPPIAFLPPDVACAIIAVLSSGDSMSTLIGKFAGRHRINSKSIEGLLAFLIFGFLAAAIFVPVQAALSLAVLGALIEFFAFMDDNFLVPVGLTAFYIFYLVIAL